MPVRVVTDSTCDLPQELREEKGVATVPLRVRFGDEIFRDRVDLSDQQFIERLTTSREPPTTSQPPPGDFEAVYRELLRRPGDEVLSIHIAGVLSGTLSSASIAADSVDPSRIHLVDSRTVSLGTGFQVLRAVELAAQGLPAAEIVTQLSRMHSRIGLVCLLDTLQYLLQGGRIGKVRALLGTALSIKPLISLGSDGAVVPVGRVRSRALGIRRLRDRLAEKGALAGCGILYVGGDQDARALFEQTRGTLPGIDILLHHASPVLSTHTGPGTLAYVYLQAEG